jgi:RHS repeat-associated protein
LYYHYDPLGSVSSLSSASGSLQWTYGYEAFGDLRVNTQDDPGASANEMLFAGEMLDDVGLYHLRARDYDAALGRFAQVDPIEQSVSDPAFSTYHYVSNRPTVMVDPSGARMTSPNTSITTTAIATTPGSAPSGSDTGSGTAGSPPQAAPTGGTLDVTGVQANIANPHFSITAYRKGRYEYVVQAWWTLRAFGKAKTLTITVKLQWKANGGWLNLGASRRESRVPPLRRVTAAARCTPNTRKTLRGKIDFDIDGYSDPPGAHYSNEVENVKCGPK